MAKPIPPNKRWLAEETESVRPKARPAPLVDPLIEILEQMVEVPQRIQGGRVRPRPGGLVQPPPTRRPLGPTILARYQGICHACGESILPGESITLHPELRWVHTYCAYQAEQKSEGE